MAADRGHGDLVHARRDDAALDRGALALLEPAPGFSFLLGLAGLTARRSRSARRKVSSATLRPAIATEVPMRRIGLAVILAVSLFLAPPGIDAQPTGKVYRIGYLSIGSPTTSTTTNRPDVDAFRQGLRESGSVPIVFSGVADPIGVGLVPRLARPGGNITGFTTSNVELSGKRLELLREAVPNLTHVAVFVNPTNPQARGFRRETTAAAVPLGLTLEFIDVADPGQLPKAFAAITSQAQALLILPDPVIGTGMAQVRIAELALEIRLPTMERSRRFADVGGLMGYGTNLQEREAARYVDRILRGAKPGDLPVQQPTKFELVINLKTAKALGLTIPPSLLLRADQVIE